MARLFGMGKARFFVGVAAGCIAGAVALWGCQGRLIFEPDIQLLAPPPGVAVEDVEIAMPGGTVTGWWFPAEQRGAKTVLYLHGNDGNVSTSVREIAPLRELGYAVLLIDYRGFGRSAGGFPSEAKVYEDAEAAWNFLVREKHLKSGELYIYGHSLGEALALELARRHSEAAGLIVESSFTSIYDMAQLERRYALLPLGLFLNQRFDSIDKVASLALPILYLHGTDDEIVPFAMGQRLHERTPAAQFVAIQGGRHDHDAAGAAVIRTAVRSFVEGRTLAALAF